MERKYVQVAHVELHPWAWSQPHHTFYTRARNWGLVTDCEQCRGQIEHTLVPSLSHLGMLSCEGRSYGTYV